MWIPHCVYQSWSTLDDLIGSSVYHIARPVSRSYSTTMPQTSHDHARSNVREDSVTLWKEAFDLPLGMSRGTWLLHQLRTYPSDRETIIWWDLIHIDQLVMVQERMMNLKTWKKWWKRRLPDLSDIPYSCTISLKVTWSKYYWKAFELACKQWPGALSHWMSE